MQSNNNTTTTTSNLSVAQPSISSQTPVYSSLSYTPKSPLFTLPLSPFTNPFNHGSQDLSQTQGNGGAGIVTPHFNSQFSSLTNKSTSNDHRHSQSISQLKNDSTRSGGLSTAFSSTQRPSFFNHNDHPYLQLKHSQIDEVSSQDEVTQVGQISPDLHASNIDSKNFEYFDYKSQNENDKKSVKSLNPEAPTSNLKGGLLCQKDQQSKENYDPIESIQRSLQQMRLQTQRALKSSVALSNSTINDSFQIQKRNLKDGKADKSKCRREISSSTDNSNTDSQSNERQPKLSQLKSERLQSINNNNINNQSSNGFANQNRVSFQPTTQKDQFKPNQQNDSKPQPPKFQVNSNNAGSIRNSIAPSPFTVRPQNQQSFQNQKNEVKKSSNLWIEEEKTPLPGQQQQQQQPQVFDKKRRMRPDYFQEEEEKRPIKKRPNQLDEQTKVDDEYIQINNHQMMAQCQSNNNERNQQPFGRQPRFGQDLTNGANGQHNNTQNKSNGSQRFTGQIQQRPNSRPLPPKQNPPQLKQPLQRQPSHLIDSTSPDPTIQQSENRLAPNNLARRPNNENNSRAVNNNERSVPKENPPQRNHQRPPMELRKCNFNTGEEQARNQSENINPTQQQQQQTNGQRNPSNNSSQPPQQRQQPRHPSQRRQNNQINATTPEPPMNQQNQGRPQQQQQQPQQQASHSEERKERSQASRRRQQQRDHTRHFSKQSMYLTKEEFLESCTSQELLDAIVKKTGMPVVIVTKRGKIVINTTVYGDKETVLTGNEPVFEAYVLEVDGKIQSNLVYCDKQILLLKMIDTDLVTSPISQENIIRHYKNVAEQTGPLIDFEAILSKAVEAKKKAEMVEQETQTEQEIKIVNVSTNDRAVLRQHYWQEEANRRRDASSNNQIPTSRQPVQNQRSASMNTQSLQQDQRQNFEENQEDQLQHQYYNHPVSQQYYENPHRSPVQQPQHYQENQYDQQRNSSNSYHSNDYNSVSGFNQSPYSVQGQNQSPYSLQGSINQNQSPQYPAPVQSNNFNSNDNMRSSGNGRHVRFENRRTRAIHHFEDVSQEQPSDAPQYRSRGGYQEARNPHHDQEVYSNGSAETVEYEGRNYVYNY